MKLIFILKQLDEVIMADPKHYNKWHICVEKDFEFHGNLSGLMKTESFKSLDKTWIKYILKKL